MTLIAKQQVALAGLAPVYTGVTASDTFVPDDDLFLHVKNAGGSPCIVTLVDKSLTAGGSAAANPTVTVPATTGDRMIGPLPIVFTDPATGLMSANYSFTTSVTAALLRM